MTEIVNFKQIKEDSRIFIHFTLKAIVDITYEIYTRQMRKHDLFKQSVTTWLPFRMDKYHSQK
jgi:hypothetical protein